MHSVHSVTGDSWCGKNQTFMFSFLKTALGSLITWVSTTSHTCWTETANIDEEKSRN